MITIGCSCGGEFQIPDEESAAELSCPHCGANAAELLAQAEPAVAEEPPAAEEEAPPAFQIGCTNHADSQATHNCMNCGKPLCMKCVRANGYYCSAECRAAVDAAEPDAVDAGMASREAVGEQVEATMAKL